MASENQQALLFEERNVAGLTSIIFLHAAASCHLEWDDVASDATLASYHLILVDLPRHSGSREIAPFSLPSAADAVARVIKNHAHGSKAHVVGMSLGGFTGLLLTGRHPEIVLSCFASGSMPYRGLFKWVAERPALMSFIGKVQDAIPGLNKLVEERQGLVITPALRKELENNQSKSLTAEIFNSIITDFGWDVVTRVANSGVRTCVVAGARVDQVGSVKEMGDILSIGGKKTNVVNTAVVVKGAVHWWNLQLPGLFAAGVSAWVASKELPSDFEKL